MNDFGPLVVAQCWSFSNEDQQVPYLIKLESADRKRLLCNCPAFSYRKTCKHVKALRESAKSGGLPFDKRFNLSDIGMSVLKIKFLEK